MLLEDDDHEPLRTEPGGAPVHTTVPSITTISDTLATILGVCRAGPHLADAFLSPPLPLSHKINLPSHQRGNDRPSKCSPKATCMALQYVMRMVARPRPIYTLLPTSVKWAHHIDDLLLTSEDLPLLQDALQAWLEHQ